MRLPRDLDAEQLMRFLERYGYAVSRQTGSHIRLARQDGSHCITVPNHKPIKIGTLHTILKDVSRANGVDIEEILR